jgi:succinoglycan biosynthesis transport protein ExoP
VLRTPRAVEQVTGRKCVVLPLVEAKSGPIEEYVLEAPYSRFTEAMRGTKALIDANRIVHGAKVIGVVSAVPNEGKTTVGANLASLMVAATGARTLLIDSDFHVRKLSATMAPGAVLVRLQATTLECPCPAVRVTGAHPQFSGTTGLARDGAIARRRTQIL